MESWLVFRRNWMIFNNLLITEWSGLLRGSPNRHSWGVFPSATGSWTFHRWQYHSMESVQHFSSNSNCNNTADVLSFTLRTALTAKPFVSDRWGVEIRWFHDEFSLKICQSPVTCQQMNFHFSDGSRKFVELCSISWKFLSCTGTTESIEWLNLASRLSIDDCFETHVPPNWRILLWSRWNRMTFNHCSKRNYWPFEWLSKSPFIRNFPVCQEVLKTLQIATAFLRIRPPYFIQAWLQQCSIHPFFHSAYRSFNKSIRLRSMVCRNSMIPWKIFTIFAKFQGIVCVHDFKFPIWLQELLQTLLRFLRSSCFARIRLDPLGGQVLHHDCISMIVSRFAIVAEDLVICCYQVTKFFCTKFDSANVFCTEPFWFWSSGRSRNFGLSGVRNSVFRNIIIHQIFPEFLQPLRDVGTWRVAPFCSGVFVFIWCWIFGWLGQLRKKICCRSTIIEWKTFHNQIHW